MGFIAFPQTPSESNTIAPNTSLSAYVVFNPPNNKVIDS